MRAILISLLLSFILCSLYAQVRVDNATGIWEISRDITPAQAEQKALFEAKREAIRMAGIPEKINTSTFVIRTVDSLYLDHFQTEISTIQINTQVKVLQKEIRNEYDPQSQRLSKVVMITAEVFEELQTDRFSPFFLQGIKNSYRAGEQIRFSFQPTDTCFFYLFNFDPEEASLLYPNTYEESRPFLPGKTYDFPLNRLITYSVNKKDKNIRYEQNITLAVVTRKNVPFDRDVSITQVLEWLYAIPISERYEEVYSFLCE